MRVSDNISFEQAVTIVVRTYDCMPRLAYEERCVPDMVDYSRPKDY